MSAEEGKTDDKLTYTGYLQLGPLLALQKPLTTARWERTFITVHQAIEMFFRDALAANEEVITDMSAGRVDGLARRISWVASAIETGESMVRHLQLLTPSEFSEFRRSLGSASGAQSQQFRELECQGGLEEGDVPMFSPVGSVEHVAVQNRKAKASLRTAFVNLLSVWGFRTTNTLMSTELMNALRRVYSEPRFTILREIAEALFEYDCAFSEFRWSHLQIVRRIIGSGNGTGGTAATSYLEKRLALRFFPEIAAIRTEVAQISPW